MLNLLTMHAPYKNQLYYVVYRNVYQSVRCCHIDKFKKNIFENTHLKTKFLN